MTAGHGLRWLLAAAWALLSAWPLAALAADVPALPAAPISLRWAVERNEFPPQAPAARSLARFTLTQRGSQPLPAQGWSLYFNCIAGVVTGPVEPGLRLSQVAGTLYRLQPAAGFAGLAPGATLVVTLAHPELMFKALKAPTGPYLVFDDAPDRGLPVADYQLETPARAEQLTRAPGDAPAQVSAEALYQRYAAIRTLPPDALPPVFPTPQAWRRGAGQLAWPVRPRGVAGPALRREAALAREWLQPHVGGGAAAAGVPPLRLLLQPIAGSDSPEAYALTVDPVQGVTLAGASAAGVQRGLQSLRDLLPVQPQPALGLRLPALTLQDAPRFAHRGVLLDVARSFHPKATVLRLIDLMARFKLNTLHLHLTDDEGWRLAIPGLPELTEVGARRGHSADALAMLPPAYGSGPAPDGPPGSGHYSAADYVEILRHAAARHIDVIPEIEMPGHARAAVKAMQARARRLAAAGDPRADAFRLDDPADRSTYRSAQLYTDHLMDPGLPSTYRFIERVVAEVVRLHRQAGVPLRTLHVGADELPAGAWARSPAASATIARLKLDGLPGLWNHFYDRVDQILRRHGLVASGWEELGARRAGTDGSGPLVPNPHFAGRGVTLYVWNNLDDADDLAYQLANAGYRTVLTPATTLYFDMAHNRDPAEPGVNWAAYIDLDTVFDHVPFDALRSAPTRPGMPAGKIALTEAGRRNVIGLQATLFSETLHDRAQLDFMLMPRLLALAERAWAPDPDWARTADAATAARLHAQAWSLFVNQLGQQVLPRLDRELPGVGWRIAPPGLVRQGAQVHANHQLPGLVLRFTTDGSEPTATSPQVAGPIETRGPVRAAAFAPDGRRGAISTLDSQSP